MEMTNILGKQLVCLFVACLLSVLVKRVSPDIFTSSRKVERLLTEENLLLSTLQQYIADQYKQVVTSPTDAQLYKQLKVLSGFHDDKSRTLQKRDAQQAKEEIKHPNGFYKAIQRLADDYIPHLGGHYDSFKEVAKQSVGGFAEYSDVEGAKLALLRLQSVYNLSPLDMADGDYLGFKGPQLDVEDLFQVARKAFTDGKLNVTIRWLQAAYTLASSSMTPTDPAILAQVLALMGRAYVFSGDIEKAAYFYKQAEIIDRTSMDLAQLGQELVTKPRAEEPVEKEYFKNFSRLCNQEQGIHTPFAKEPSIVCRYRDGLLPYYRFKEEILSESPFVSVIYNVITDEENSFIRTFANDKLKRSLVGLDGVETTIRTSDTLWIWDMDSPIAHTISQRVTAITGLDTQQRELEDGSSSAEAFQVVNYGLGGQYEVHIDQLIEEGLPATHERLRYSGDRIATFLIYLTDIERGGATVFTRAGISVAPVKNMALLWYGYKPSYEVDSLTEHAGCPVLIGQKWIVNKWIWTHGNTFRRRCGLSPDVTQLDIEKDMKNHYGVR